MLSACRFQHDSSLASACECFTCGWQHSGVGGLSVVSGTEMAPAASSSVDDLSSRALWVCLICGFTGCALANQQAGGPGRSHISAHYEETLHTYAMCTENRRVWDFAGDGYVHRLILNGGVASVSAGVGLSVAESGAVDSSIVNSSENGAHPPSVKMVEVSERRHAEYGRDARPPLSSEQEEAIVSRKLESAAYHYNQLLAWQMQQNRLAYETRLQRIRESVAGQQQQLPAAVATGGRPGQSCWQENMLSSLRQERARLGKQVEAAEERLVRVRKELGVHTELNRSLLHNQGEWHARVQAANDRCQQAEQANRCEHCSLCCCEYLSECLSLQASHRAVGAARAATDGAAGCGAPDVHWG